jgi:uncharacterized protein YlxW (UPF0749 family)
MFRDRVEELEEEARKTDGTVEKLKTHIVDEEKAIKNYERFKETAYNNINMSTLETYYMLSGYLIGMNCSGIISDSTHSILTSKLKKEIIDIG